MALLEDNHSADCLADCREAVGIAVRSKSVVVGHRLVDRCPMDSSVAHNQGMNQAIVGCSEDNTDPDFVDWGRLVADT